MYITLREWWKNNYSGVYNPEKIARWARLGHISPQPEKHGREYRVKHDAIYLTTDKRVNVVDQKKVQSSTEQSLSALLDSVNKLIG